MRCIVNDQLYYVNVMILGEKFDICCMNKSNVYVICKNM